VGVILIVFGIGDVAYALTRSIPRQTTASLLLIRGKAPNSGGGHTLPMIPGEAAPTPLPTPTPLPSVSVSTDYPTQLQLGDSDSISVTLVNGRDQSLSPIIRVQAHADVTGTVIAVGTPGVPITDALGRGYKAAASVVLTGQKLDPQPVVQPSESLDQPQLFWRWVIDPQSAGHQIADVVVNVEWTPKGRGQRRSYPLWISPDLKVNVDQSHFTLGQISILPLLSELLGSILSAPFLYGVYKDRKKPNSTPATKTSA
jgi:hypothetical protein